jgi:ribose-phosphate pyrophosphokinase
MKLFSGTTNNDFSELIAKHLEVSLSSLDIDRFADGEIKVTINECIRQEDCVIIQPTCRNNDNNTSVNDSIMELLIIIDALKRGSAKSVIVIMPYYGYQRQDRKDYGRAPISASIIAKCLESLNISKIIVFDLHAGQISGFFSNNCPLDNLYSEQYFLKYIRQHVLPKYNLDDIIVVSPDEGAIKNNYRIATYLGCDIASIFKSRVKDNEVNVMKLIGSVKDKVVIMVDDIIDTAGTACSASKLLKDEGAKEIYFFCCHGLFSRNALERIDTSSFTKVIVTNTIPHSSIVLNNPLIDIIDVSWLCSEAIYRQLNGISISELYDETKFNEKLESIKLLKNN